MISGKEFRSRQSVGGRERAGLYFRSWRLTLSSDLVSEPRHSVSLLDKFFVDPVAAVVTPPHSPPQKAAGDRAPWNGDRPQMPVFHPGSGRVAHEVEVLALRGE
jgi:hypothetical protein